MPSALSTVYPPLLTLPYTRYQVYVRYPLASVASALVCDTTKFKQGVAAGYAGGASGDNAGCFFLQCFCISFVGHFLPLRVIVLFTVLHQTVQEVQGATKYVARHWRSREFLC